MAGIEFTSSFDHTPFVRSANAIMSTINTMAARIEREGRSMQNALDSIFDGDKLGKGMDSLFERIISNLNMSEKAAESFRDKATAAIRDIINAGGDASEQMSKIATSVTQIAMESRNVDMSGLSSGASAQSLEDMRTSAAFLIDSFNDAVTAYENMKNKLASGGVGDTFGEAKQSTEEYKNKVEEASAAAEKAIKAQQEYVNALTAELDKMMNSMPKEGESGFDTWEEDLKELSDTTQKATETLKELRATKDRIVNDQRPMIPNVSSTTGAVGDLNEKLKGTGQQMEKLRFNTDEANAAFQRYAEETRQSSMDIQGSLQRIAALAGIAFGINEAANFVHHVAETRTYFQDIESSMKVFLGSEEKATEFTQKLKDYAWFNMFEFSDLAKASQQMIAYGQDVDTIIPKLDMLSNVAAGTHAPLMEMVDAYNRAKSTGVVDAMGIRSWAVKGVVIKDVLRDMGEQATSTSITFEQLNKVLEHITGEGGMFHNLMKEQLNNISAEKGQLEDNLANMYNEIGEKLQGAITKWYKLQSDMVDNYTDIAGGDNTIDFVVNVAESGMDFLMDNWKQLMGYIKDAIALYGSWRVALAATTAAEKAHAYWVGLGTEAIIQNKLATEADIIAKGKATRATVLWNRAVDAFNKSMLASPWTWAALAITGLIYAIYKAKSAYMTEEEAIRRVSGAMDDYKDKLTEEESAVNSSLKKIKDKTASLHEQYVAYKELISTRKAFADYSQEEISQMSQEQFDRILKIDTSNQQHDYIERTKKAYDEFFEWVKKEGKEGFAFWESGELEKLKEIQKAYGLGTAMEDEWDSTSSWTNVRAWAEEMANAAGKTLSERLEEEAAAGVVRGFGRGLSDSSQNTQMRQLMTDFVNNGLIESEAVRSQVKNVNSDIENARKRLQELKKEREKEDKNDPHSAERLTEIIKLQKKIASLTEESDRLSASTGDIAEKYKSQVRPAIEEAENKFKELNRQLLLSTSDTEKKKIEAEIVATQNDLETLKSLMSFFDAGVDNKKLTLEIIRKNENETIGAEKVIEIGKAYAEAEQMANKYITAVENAAKEAKETGATTKDELEEIAKKYGVTAENAEGDFGEMKKALEKDIQEVRAAYDKAKPEEKDKWKIELDKKEKLLAYFNTLNSAVQQLVGQRHTIFIDIDGDAMQYAKGLLGIGEQPTPYNGKQGGVVNTPWGQAPNWAQTPNYSAPFAFNKGAQQRADYNAQQAQEDAAQAKKTKEQNKPEPRKSSKEYLTEREKAEAKKAQDYLQYKSGKGVIDVGGTKYDLSKLTAEENDKLQTYFKGADALLKKNGQVAKQAKEQNARRVAEQLRHEDEMEDLIYKAEDARARAEIAAIKDDGERKRAEEEYQHQKEIKDIQRQNDEIYKKIYQEREKKYENENKGEKYKNTAEGAAGWRGIRDAAQSVQEVQTSERAMVEALAKTNLSVNDAVQEILNSPSFQGNVDLLARPLVDAAKLAEKGWKDAGEGIATVFSSQNAFADKEGKEREILYTPILPNGEVLTEEEVTAYLQDVISKSTDKAQMLANDTKGIIIGVDVPVDEGVGDRLHILHELLLDTLSEEDKNKLIERWNDVAKTFGGFSDEEKRQLEIQNSTTKSKLEENAANYEKSYRDRMKSLVNLGMGTMNKMLELDKEYAKNSKDIDAGIEEARQKGDEETVNRLTLSREELMRDYEKNKREILGIQKTYDQRYQEIENESQEALNYLLAEEERLRKAINQAKKEGREEDAKDLENQLEQNKEQQTQIKDKKARDLKNLNKEYDDVYKRLARGNYRKTIGEIVGTLGKAREDMDDLLNKPRTDARKEEIRELSKEVENLQSQLESQFTAEGLLGYLFSSETDADGNKVPFAQKIKNIKEAWKNMTPDQKNVIVWNAVGKAVAGIAEGMQKAADYMHQLAELSGDTGLDETADELSAVAQNLNAAGQGAQSGGWIGAIIGGASDIVSQVTDSLVNMSLQEEIAAKNAREWAEAVEIAALAVKTLDYETPFGTKDISLASARYKEAADALALYEKKINDLNEETREQDSLWREHGGRMGQFLADANATYQGLKRMQIKTVDNSGWANAFGIADEYTSLGELAPELWDENGELVIENAKKFLEVNTQINDEQKKQIQNLIDLKEEYEDAMKAVDDAISENFGSIASEWTDIIWDSVVNGGTDAWSEFNKVGAEVITKLGKQLISEMIISSYLENFREELKESYKASDPQEAIKKQRDIMNRMMSGMDKAYELGRAVAVDFDNWATEQGYDLSDNSYSQNASGRSFQTISQETGDELSGRFAALQVSGEEIFHTTMQTSETAKAILVCIQGMSAIMSSNSGSLSSLQEMAAVRNSLLTDIATYSKKMYDEFKVKIEAIVDNTNTLK